MFNCLKRVHNFIIYIDSMVGKHQRALGINRVKDLPLLVNYHSQIRLYKVIPSKSFLIHNYQPRLIILRNKHKGKKAYYKRDEERESSDDEDEIEDEDEDEDIEADRKNRLKTFNLNSKRVDLLLKSAFKMSRKKIEDAFYQNKIRINGKIILKKSHNVDVDDNIDLIYGMEDHTSNTLKVGRIQILHIDVDPDTENYIIKVYLFKSLIINNYTHGNTWKESEEEN